MMTKPVDVTVEDDRPPEDTPIGTTEPIEDVGDPLEPSFVSEEEMAGAIRGIGEMIHTVVGHPEVATHWNFTDKEVAQLAPPVTSIVNRHPSLQRLAERSPEVAAAAALGKWGFRNVRLTAEIRQIEEERAAEAEAAEAEGDTETEAEGRDVGPQSPRGPLNG